MTEDEAKTKWCPMVRSAYGTRACGNAAINRESSNAQCIASDCMMWKKGVSPHAPINEQGGHCGLAK